MRAISWLLSLQLSKAPSSSKNSRLQDHQNDAIPKNTRFHGVDNVAINGYKGKLPYQSSPYSAPDSSLNTPDFGRMLGNGVRGETSRHGPRPHLTSPLLDLQTLSSSADVFEDLNSPTLVSYHPALAHNKLKPETQ
jgi:hypothetical protein